MPFDYIICFYTSGYVFVRYLYLAINQIVQVSFCLGCSNFFYLKYIKILFFNLFWILEHEKKFTASKFETLVSN